MSHNALPTPLRRSLEKVIRQARDLAETGAADAIRRLGVEDAKAPAHLDETGKALRRRLRAHGRALGDTLTNEQQTTVCLMEATAYAHWHRMLFARFLAERGLLHHPTHGVAVSLEECDELAAEEDLPDAWAVAEHYAAGMLPAVFKPEDPVLALEFAPEHAVALQALVKGLDTAVFEADDSLGWTYQFWRSAEKDAVNKSGDKIGAKELPAVTQLFTEPYMVRFLLHNTLGAWWAGKVLAENPNLATTAADETELRKACALPGIEWDMLRFVKENDIWRPAAGTFEGWPKEAKALTVLDPCCGSGHFLTETLPILTALRQAEADLTPSKAVAAVLRDNLFGLEIDGRCVQIAAFAVALNAWKIGGWQTLPLPHIAWVGSPPPLDKTDFMALANGDERLRESLATLHDMFMQAPILGSLLDPKADKRGALFEQAQAQALEGAFDSLVDKLRNAEPERVEGAIAARGMADAAAILNRRFTLQVTNVPFLAKGKQVSLLSNYIEKNFYESRTDLATAMLSRMTNLSCESGVIAAVTPQNWLFQISYKKFREKLLNAMLFNFVATLGTQAFSSLSGWVVNTVLISFEKLESKKIGDFMGIDVSHADEPDKKANQLIDTTLINVSQQEQYQRTDKSILFVSESDNQLLSHYADYRNGIQTGDYSRFGQKFWEQMDFNNSWEFFATTVSVSKDFDGLHGILKWQQGTGALNNSSAAVIRGTQAWKKTGIAVSAMGELFTSLYTGSFYDDNLVCLIPKHESNILPIWAYCSSAAYNTDVRTYDKALKVRAGLTRVPFDLEHWQKVAAEKYPNGLPEPYSDDPTQWLFHGHPAKAEKGTPLHVALARLAGYQWPAETDTEMRLAPEAREWISKAALLPPGDNDGILCLPAVAGERSLADRLRVYLVEAFGADWSNDLERQLILEADERFNTKSKDLSLEVWLQDRAFKQHCKLFHKRPFLWHIWDGSKDGFSAIVHYHRLDQATMRKLTYTVLGDWLARAKAEGNTRYQEKGRELQQTLEKILEGEDPYDIFVRWKALERLPIGWNPDLDDGVRMNIRPFMTAGILKDKPNIKWGKDRGTDVKSAPWYHLGPTYGGKEGDRINEHHTSRAEKQAARQKVTERLTEAQGVRL
jgi:hypothetical protein